ncbi:MAG TPA: hypothetical protein VLJ39_09940 [Tepidisphaeraceae bacterium]|nr:hypothetical protein [Tepidisphaeraceae bacterium]
MPIPLPKWFEGPWDDEHQERSAKAKFFLAIAAQYYQPGGTIASLGAHLGYQHPAGIYAQISRNGEVSAEHAVILERLAGRNVLPRELLRPDIFDIPEEETW